MDVLADPSRSLGAVSQPVEARVARYSYIVPAHNEEEVLEESVTRIVERLRSYPGSEVLIIENGSRDRTPEIAAELAARDWDGVDVRAYTSEPGLAPAYRLGAQHATGDYVVFTAADLPFGFSDLDRFLELRPESTAFVIGSKAHRDSVVERQLSRTVMSMGFRVLRRLMLGPTAADPQGVLILRGDLARELAARTREGGFLFGTEMVALARGEGIQPVEVPIQLHDERRSSTVKPVQDSWKMLKGLARLRRRIDIEAASANAPTAAPSTLLGLVGRAARVPAALFLAVLGVCALAGATVVACKAIEKLSIRLGDSSPTTPELVASVTAVVVAVAVAVVAARALVRFIVERVANGRGEIGDANERGANHWASVAGAVSEQRSRTGSWIAATVLAPVVAATALLWRVVGDLGSVGVGAGDARYWYWAGWRLAEQVRDGDLLPLTTDAVVWPNGYDFRIADGLLPAVVGGFWNLITGSPTLAYNLATATALVTTCLAGVRLAKTVGASPAVAAVVGCAITTAPAFAIRLEGHYNLLFAFPAILLVDVGLRHVSGQTRVFPIARTAVLLALAYTSSGYYLFAGGLALAIVLLFGRLGRVGTTEAAVRLAIAGAVAAVILSPLLVPKMRLERAERDAGAVPITTTAASFSSDATAIFVPPAGSLVEPPDVQERNERIGFNLVERTAFPGWLGLLGVAGVLFVRSPYKRPLLAASAVLWVLSLGPTLRFKGRYLGSPNEYLPMTAFLKLPGFSGVRAPNRMSFLIAVLAGAAAAVFLEALRRWSGRRFAAIAVALGIALVAASLRVPVATAREPSGAIVTALEQVRADPSDGAVLHLPEDCLNSIPEVELQVIHQRNLVGCQGFESAIPWYTELGNYTSSASWAALRCFPEHLGPAPSPFPPDLPATDDAVRALTAELGVAFVIFDQWEKCDRAAEIREALLRTAEVVGGDDHFLVLKVGG